MLSRLEMRSAWMKCVSFLCSSPCLSITCFLALLHTSSVHAHKKLTTFWSDCWAQPQRLDTSTSLQRRSRGSGEVEEQEEEEEHEKVIEAKQRREEATVSHVQRHNCCDWAVSVSARWVTERKRKMKGCGRVQWKKKRRILVKLKAGQWQMEIQGDWYACHSGKC